MVGRRGGKVGTDILRVELMCSAVPATHCTDLL